MIPMLNVSTTVITTGKVMNAATTTGRGTNAVITTEKALTAVIRKGTTAADVITENHDTFQQIRNAMKNFIFVFQNAYLFEETIANNISFGEPEAPMKRVTEAAKKGIFCLLQKRLKIRA